MAVNCLTLFFIVVNGWMNLLVGNVDVNHANDPYEKNMSLCIGIRFRVKHFRYQGVFNICNDTSPFSSLASISSKMTEVSMII